MIDKDNEHLVVGITGPTASGKGVVINFLLKKYNFTHYSVRDYLANILNEKNIQINRKNLLKLANNLREINGPEFLVNVIDSKINKNNKNFIIESIRNPFEIKYLKRKYNRFVLISVESPFNQRWERIKKDKKINDNSGLKEYSALDNKEMQTGRSYESNLLACMSKADFVINNNSSYYKLEKETLKVLKQINKLYKLSTKEELQ